MTALPPAAPAQSVGGLRQSGACNLQAVARCSRQIGGAGYNAAAARGSAATTLLAR